MRDLLAYRSLGKMTLIVALSGCGLGETATAAAVGAKTKAQEVEQAQAMKQEVVEEIDKANQLARERLNEAESR
jgi:hypothetical protein